MIMGNDNQPFNGRIFSKINGKTVEILAKSLFPIHLFGF